jgi:selenide,water dikinase
LRHLPRPTDPNVLVGFETSDDAGVYQLTGELALVQTVDFFTPIVDDPHLYGQIAATNSLSDVYAMGGRPVSALSIVAFPPNGDPAILREIIAGGQSKMAEAACSIIGGHSIRDDDMKFGYAVTGVINPKCVWRNVGAQPGDVLLLTKPIGTGIISTALKSGKASEESLAASVASMTRLNRDAAEALHEMDAVGARHPSASLRTGAVPAGGVKPPLQKNTSEPPALQGLIHAVTDVTGFGLLGHAKEMAAGSSVSLELNHRKVEPLPGALEGARAGFLAGGLKNNREWLEGCVEFDSAVPEEYRHLLFDPQTSGGLLVAIAAACADAALAALAKRNVPARVVGSVTAKRSPLILVR